MKRLRPAAALGAALTVSCSTLNLGRSAHAPQRAAQPSTRSAKASSPAAPSDPMSRPPPSAPLERTPFPAVTHETLPGGLGVWIVSKHHWPLVRVAFVVKSGRAEDGAKPGVAELTAKLLARGGAGRWGAWQWRNRIAALGSELEASSSLDAIQLALSVTSQRLDGALDILAQAVTRPSFSLHEFLIARERAAEQAESSNDQPRSLSLQIAFRELYQLPAAAHPYTRYADDASALRHVTLNDCRRWYRAHVSPPNAFVVIAGDVSAPAVEHALSQRFERWKGGKTTVRPSFTAPMPPDRTRVFIVDRPGSRRSQIRLATLGPGPKSKDFAALEAAAEIVADAAPPEPDFGARSGDSDVEAFALAHPPAPIFVRAEARTVDTARRVSELLARVDQVDRTGPTERELDVAVQRLVASYEPRLAHTRTLADLVASLGVLGLPSNAYDTLRDALDNLTPRDVHAAARASLRRRHVLILVAGDAGRVASALRRFGPVSVVEPGQGLSIARTLAADRAAR